MPLLEDLIPPLVTAYRDLYQRQKNIARLQHGKKDEFFGLRDFYRCVVKLQLHILSMLIKFVTILVCVCWVWCVSCSQTFPVYALNSVHKVFSWNPPDTVGRFYFYTSLKIIFIGSYCKGMLIIFVSCYFSLVKMIFHIAKKQRRSPNWQELERAIKRNFGGLLEEDFVPVKIFKQHLRFPPEFLQVRFTFLNTANKCNSRKQTIISQSWLPKRLYLSAILFTLLKVFFPFVSWSRTSTNILTLHNGYLSTTAAFLVDSPYIDLFKPLHNGYFLLSPRRLFSRDSDKCMW